jgi:hypothetical protein
MTQEALKLALIALEINLTLLKKITPYKGQEDFLSDPIAITQDTTTFIKEALAQPEQDIAALVTGMEVSIDVSTGDHDSGHRLFCLLYTSDAADD